MTTRISSQGKQVISKTVLSKNINWVFGDWISIHTKLPMQRALSFQTGVSRTETYTSGLTVKLSDTLSASFGKSIAWGETITKTDTVTINIEP
jgi:hypothetical protein